MSRFFVICFDISDPKRLYRVSDTLENFGCRVQRSIFECYLDPGELEKLKTGIAALIDENEDHVRYYSLCPKDVKKIKVKGAGKVTSNPDFFCI